MLLWYDNFYEQCVEWYKDINFIEMKTLQATSLKASKKNHNPDVNPSATAYMPLLLKRRDISAVTS